METQGLEVDRALECRWWSLCLTRPLLLSPAFELCLPVVLERHGDHRARPALQAPWLSQRLALPSYRLLPECSPNSLPVQLLYLHSKQRPMINGQTQYCLLFLAPWPLVSRWGSPMPRGCIPLVLLKLRILQWPAFVQYRHPCNTIKDLSGLYPWFLRGNFYIFRISWVTAVSLLFMGAPWTRPGFMLMR